MDKANKPSKKRTETASLKSQLQKLSEAMKPLDLHSQFDAVFKEFQKEPSLSSKMSAAFGWDVITGLSDLGKEFLIAQSRFDEEMDRALFLLIQQPFAGAFGAWVTQMRALDQNVVVYCNEIFKLKILPIHDTIQSFSVLQASTLNHDQIINDIRSLRDKTIELREHLVSTYISFINWLSQVTYSYIKPIVDPDQIKRDGRVVSYPVFIKLLGCLDDRSQVVAKLLYFGGTRTLEEVLDLDLKHVDFKTNYINYRSQLVRYPQHILDDIKALTVHRTSGRIFLGRQNTPMNPSTIFRNFKEAGSKVGLGDSFSPKMLIINI